MTWEDAAFLIFEIGLIGCVVYAFLLLVLWAALGWVKRQWASERKSDERSTF